MNELCRKMEITEIQAETIAKGLLAVARADGSIHPREAALIAEFYASTTDNPADLGHLERSSELDVALLPALLPTPELQELFLKTALLVAYTDGECAPGEQKLIDDYAAALGIRDEAMQQLHLEVKEFLLSQLSHLQNVDASVQVAEELKI